MTESSLSNLYRRLTAQPTLSARALLDSETLARVAAGRVVPSERDEVATALAASAPHAALARLLGDLAPESAALARGLAQTGHRSHTDRIRHGQQAAGARRASRRLQWSALAACLIAGVALWAAHTARRHAVEEATLATAMSAHPDEIFGSSLDQRMAARHAGPPGDVIFRTGERAGAGDEIFRSSFKGS